MPDRPKPSVKHIAITMPSGSVEELTLQEANELLSALEKVLGKNAPVTITPSPYPAQPFVAERPPRRWWMDDVPPTYPTIWCSSGRTT